MSKSWCEEHKVTKPQDFTNKEETYAARNANGTGPYVLNLSVHATPNPPRVVATSLTEGAVLDRPTTQFTVQFTEPVNLQHGSPIVTFTGLIAW